nr:MAG TPA: hypothetical protein [Caudoviricetes sp.]
MTSVFEIHYFASGKLKVDTFQMESYFAGELSKSRLFTLYHR